MMIRYPLCIVVDANSPLHSVDDLVQFAKKEPGKLNYASIGQGSVNHLTAEWFKQKAGIKRVARRGRWFQRDSGLFVSGANELSGS